MHGSIKNKDDSDSVHKWHNVDFKMSWTMSEFDQTATVLFQSRAKETIMK